MDGFDAFAFAIGSASYSVTASSNVIFDSTGFKIVTFCRLTP